VVLNRGSAPTQGSVSKFPGEHDPLRALQHGMFDHEIYQ